MKKYISILFFLFFLNIVQAQRFKAGLSAGLTVTDVNGADTRDYDNDFNKLGCTFGGIVNSVLNEKNTLQLEINYVQKGTMQRPDSANNGYYKISLDYIEIPLLLRHHMHFSIRKKPVDKFDWEMGISVGRLIRVKELYDNSALSISPGFNKTDVSIIAGLDYTITSNVYFCLRYSNSVIPVISRSDLPLYLYRYSYNKGNNMVFQFTFKFVFGNGEDQTEAATL